MEKEIEYSFSGEGLTTLEKRWGGFRFKDYRKSYPHLNKLGNLQLLEELVWAEAIQERFKKQVGELEGDTSRGKADGSNAEKRKSEPISSKLLEAIDNGLTQIILLKTKLGMFEDQKQTDEFKRMQELEEKAAEYRRQHPLSYKITCPRCAGICYLKRKTEGYEEFISPFYADDKVLKNDELHSDYKKGIFTKERYASYLGVSPDYIDWLDEKIYHNVKKDISATPEVPEVK
jgi:hypothetical protein